MKYFNSIMWVIRILAIVIIVLCVYALLADKKAIIDFIVSYYLLGFVGIYFFGSLFQMLMRLRASGQYQASQHSEETQNNEKENKNE